MRGCLLCKSPWYCLDKCGNVTIPYPFGVTEKCYMGPEFFINCTADRTAFLRKTNIRVNNISVDLGEIQVQQYRAYDCYDEMGKRNHNMPWIWVAPPYTISSTKNKFMAIGCDTYATFGGYRANQERFITGCISFCDRLYSGEQDSCSGIGCCLTSIPDGLKNCTVTLASHYNDTYIRSFNPCSYAFVVQEGHFRFSNTSFQQLNHTAQLPMILNWEIGNEPCDAAQEATQNSICKAHSKCVNPNNRSTGYICQCLPGYEGNPYHPNGCQGYKNDGMNPKSCIKDNRSKTILLLIISLAELLTSRVALCFGRPEAERNLASFFVCSVEEDRLNQILDDDIVNDGNIETLKNVAILAKRCLRLQGEERPTMKEVALELEGMRIKAKHPWGKADCPEETEHLLGSGKSDAYCVDVTAADCGHPSGTSSGYDSMQIQMLTSYGDGR
ncbi:unnamed protein product [Prunus armeniaca]|uniref:EGF-like domain-containing protein n=1 Tax=Prunus armeniaca TaxID=36596 RepID=A0A6J5WYS4_PRUAR|nr:unnamed protein product [Prunus armeniaca]